MSKTQPEAAHTKQQEAAFKLIDGASLFKNYLDMPVWQLRHLEVSRFIQKHGIKNILDIGCAQATLLNRLSRSSEITKLIGIDLDEKVLEVAKTNCSPELMQEDISYQRKQPLYIELYKLNALESLPYNQLSGIELVTMIQFIQHLKQQDLPTICEQVFGLLRPKFAIITTPNRQFNVHFDFKPGQMRHPQHIFQWDRQQFHHFCSSLALKYNYSFQLFGIGQHATSQKEGFCSQGAFFTSLSQKDADNTHGKQKINIQPYFSVKYPFWKDKMNFYLQSQLRNIILRNNFQLPENILSLFKQSKIGKRIIRQKQSKMGNNKNEIEKEENELPQMSVEWVIETAKKIKYCGFNEEYNYLFYQYEPSSMEDDGEYEELRQENKTEQYSKM